MVLTGVNLKIEPGETSQRNPGEEKELLSVWLLQGLAG